MKILIIGGTHGNEPLGINLVKKINSKPIKNVSAILGNEKAILKNSRFIKTDLNRSFPGSTKSRDYENKRAAELLNECKKYDLVLDFHNSYCPNNNCSFLGQLAQKKLFNISSWLGFNRVVVADYDCINKYASNCLSVEISMNSNLIDVDEWYKKINKLSKLEFIPSTKDIKKYRFVYRITLADRDKFKLKKANLKAFIPINKKLADKIGVISPAYPIFIDDKFTPYNYGGLLNKL